MTRAMLLCAGFGTRLGALTSDRPKPMLPVCDVPIVRYGIALLVGHGITDIVINTHHGAESIKRALGDGSAFGASIQYSHEEEILGTGGGIKQALSLLDPDGADEPFISMNGKLIFDLDLGALVNAFEADRKALGMMVVRRVPNALEWGAVQIEEVDGSSRVGSVLEDKGEHMFCGVHITRPSVMARLPDGEACSIRQGYVPWMKAGEAVAAFEAPAEAYFAEHSTAERYVASNHALLSGVKLSHPPGLLRGVHSSAHIHSTAVLRHPLLIGPGAHIGEGAEVGSYTTVGSHGIVDAGARVERSIVWPGAHAHGEVSDSIVTCGGVVNVISEIGRLV